ncbi:hypothetical protein [Sutterella wadsworthensis]|nr:hypothetical protein [Sutterella wadsworthensis]
MVLSDPMAATAIIDRLMHTALPLQSMATATD